MALSLGIAYRGRCHRLLYYALSWHHHLVLPTDSVALIRQCQRDNALKGHNIVAEGIALGR